MVKKIRKYIEQHEMIASGDTVCVGLSGGADSVCLLQVLLELYGAQSSAGQSVMMMPGEEADIHMLPDGKTADGKAGLKESVRISAVHVNHRLRGADADRDEAFVRELCGSAGVPLTVYRYPVREIAKERGIGTEEAGRLARREAYRDCLENHGATVIALAHHANDCAETFLFHAARGASLAGLAGIRPVQSLSFSGEECARARRDTGGSKEKGQAGFCGKQNTDGSCAGARIVRPLLCVTREEIEAWLRERGQIWCNDATNHDETYTRNALRHTFIPLMESRINVQAVRHIAETAADVDEVDRFLRDEAQRRAERYLQQSDEEIRIDSSLSDEPAILQGYMLLDAMERLGGSRKDLGREQVRQLRELFGLQTGKGIDLPYELCAVREYRGICLYKKSSASAAGLFGRTGRGEKHDAQEEDGVSVDTDTAAGTYLWNGWKFHMRIREVFRTDTAAGTILRPEDIPRKKYTKWLDCDKINGTLFVRSRRQGDRVVINARGGSRKLKDYLIDKKVPREERDGIPLLTSGTKVLWVVGYRISEDAKVTETTRRILEITAEPPLPKEEERPQTGRTLHHRNSPGAGLYGAIQKRRE